MFVEGSPQAARELSSDLVAQMKAIRASLESINSDLRNLGGSFQDEGYEELSAMVRSVANATLKAMEPVSNVCKSLRRYAEILENS